MARVASGYSVGTKEREPVLVRAQRLHCRFPSERRVALLAVGAELASVKVGVAVLALCSHVAELHVGVTGSAGNVLMQATERKLRLDVVIELGHATNRPPACGGVAVAAGNLYRTVRISDISLLCNCRETQQDQ